MVGHHGVSVRISVRRRRFQHTLIHALAAGVRRTRSARAGCWGNEPDVVQLAVSLGSGLLLLFLDPVRQRDVRPMRARRLRTQGLGLSRVRIHRAVPSQLGKILCSRASSPLIQSHGGEGGLQDASSRSSYSSRVSCHPVVSLEPAICLSIQDGVCRGIQYGLRAHNQTGRCQSRVRKKVGIS